MSAIASMFSQSFFHGTKADLKPGDLIAVGHQSNFAEAKAAWLGKAQATVDNAQMRYFVAHIHRLFEMEEEPQQDAED